MQWAKPLKGIRIIVIMKAVGGVGGKGEEEKRRRERGLQESRGAA